MGGGEFLREHDCMLSERFLEVEERGSINSDWASANKCQIYLKVLSVANLSSGSCLEIDTNYLKKGTHQGEEYRNLQWPIQG